MVIATTSGERCNKLLRLSNREGSVFYRWQDPYVASRVVEVPAVEDATQKAKFPVKESGVVQIGTSSGSGSGFVVAEPGNKLEVWANGQKEGEKVRVTYTYLTGSDLEETTEGITLRSKVIATKPKFSVKEAYTVVVQRYCFSKSAN